MTGRHADGLPVASAAREITASPYIGRHRQTIALPAGHGIAVDWSQPGEDRCWSCGHPFDAGCECTCCYDDHDDRNS